jgi:hypothetical protein
MMCLWCIVHACEKVVFAHVITSAIAYDRQCTDRSFFNTGSKFGREVYAKIYKEKIGLRARLLIDTLEK